MSNVRQAVIFSSISRAILHLISLVSMVLVARLLTPMEIGVFAIASAAVIVLLEFRLLGAGSYLVREAEISTEKIRSALGLTVIISWGLGALVFLCAPLVGDFYDLPPVATILRILSINFFLGPFISIPISLLSRDFKFKSIFYIQVTASVCGLACTLGLIFSGYSFYSIAWGKACVALVSFAMVCLLRPQHAPWLPAFNHLKPIVGFGIYTSVAALLKKSATVVPDLVIGKVGNPTQVAIFSRGVGLVQFLSQSVIMGVQPVALPYLSDTKRKGGDVTWAYTRASVLVGGMVLPILAVASASSLPVIRLMFGEQWDASAPLASWLALWAMLRTVHWFSHSALITNGKEKVLVAKESFVFVCYLAGVILSYPYGLDAIALAFVAAGITDMAVTSIVLRKTIGLSLGNFFRAWIPNILLTSICWGATQLIAHYIDFSQSNYFEPILVIALVLPPVYLLALLALRHPLFSEIAGLSKGIWAKLRNQDE